MDLEAAMHAHLSAMHSSTRSRGTGQSDNSQDGITTQSSHGSKHGSGPSSKTSSKGSDSDAIDDFCSVDGRAGGASGRVVVHMTGTSVSAGGSGRVSATMNMMDIFEADYDQTMDDFTEFSAEPSASGSFDVTASGGHTAMPRYPEVPRALRFTRLPPVWLFQRGRVTPQERAALPDVLNPKDTAMFRIFPLRGPRDLALMLTDLGFAFDSTAKTGILRARLPRDPYANRCAGYAFIECRNASVAALLERRIEGTMLTAPGTEDEISYSIGVGQARQRSNPSTRKLKLEWKSVVAPGCLTTPQQEIVFDELMRYPEMVTNQT